MEQPRQCFTTTSTDGTTHVAEFEPNQTAAVRHTKISPDGKVETWPTEQHGKAQ